MNFEEEIKKLIEIVKAKDEQIDRLLESSKNGGNFGGQQMKNIADMMTTFHYDPDNNSVFEGWYNRHESILASVKDLDEPSKVRLLLQKFSDTDYQKFADSILPKKPAEMKLDEVVKSLSTMFGYKETKFSQRHECFNLTKLDSEDYTAYAARINKHGEKFDIKNCTADDLKILLFVSGLSSSHETIILEKLLVKVDTYYIKAEAAREDEDAAEPKKLTLDDLVNEAHRIVALRKDKSAIIESKTSSSEVLSVQQYNRGDTASSRNPGNSSTGPNKPNRGDTTSPINSGQSSSEPNSKQKLFCKYCGDYHRYVDCPYRYQKCCRCNVAGHKTGFCLSAMYTAE